MRCCGLLVHVRDLDSFDRSDRRPQRERRAGLVGVDVNLERARVADDEERVAQLLELGFERVGVEVLSLDHEDRAVPELRQLLVDRVDPGLVSVLAGGVGQRLAGQRRGDAANDLEQARATRVDDPRLLENGELVRRARERVLAALDQLLQQRRGLEICVAGVLGLLGELADHRQHRSLHRTPHRAVGGVARSAEGAADRGGIEQPRLAQRFGGTAQDLGEDHARVPAGAHQRRTRQLLRERRRGPSAVETSSTSMIARAVSRQVRARVAVRHGIHVQVVDAAAVRLECLERRSPELAGPLQLRHADRRTSSMCTSTAATWRPVSRSTS